MTPPPQPPSSAPISSDLLCIQCQYNLRTRTPQDRCPECNFPIADTLSHYHANAGVILQPRLLRTAAWCFALPCFLSLFPFAASCILLYFAGIGGPPWLPLAQVSLQYLAHILFLAALVFGVFFFAASVSKLIISAAARSALILLSTLYAAINSLIFLSMLGFLFRARRRPMRFFIPLLWVREQRIGSALICLILALAGFVLMRRLAKALASPKLLQFTHLAFAAVILDSAFSLLFYGIAGTWRWSRNFTQFDSLFLAIDLASTAVSLLFGFYWLSVSRTLREKTQPPTPQDPIYPAPPLAHPENKVEQFLAGKRTNHAG